MAFSVSEYGELTTLHRALMEAKFSADPENLYLAASPLLIDLMSRVIDELIAAREALGYPSSWETWRANPSWLYQMRIVEAARREPQWQAWSHDERVAELELLAAPFVLSQTLKDELLDRIAAEPD